MLRKLAGIVAIKQIIDRNFRGRGRRTGNYRTPGSTTGGVNRNVKRGLLRRKSYGVR